MTSTLENPTEERDEPFLSTPAARKRLHDLPPSAKLVAKVLELEGEMVQGQLAAESLLPDRTVRYALNRLKEADLVGSRYSLEDARKQVYYLDDRSPRSQE